MTANMLACNSCGAMLNKNDDKIEATILFKFKVYLDSTIKILRLHHKPTGEARRFLISQSIKTLPKSHYTTFELKNEYLI